MCISSEQETSKFLVLPSVYCTHNTFLLSCMDEPVSEKLFCSAVVMI